MYILKKIFTHICVTFTYGCLNLGVSRVYFSRDWISQDKQTTFKSLLKQTLLSTSQH